MTEHGSNEKGRVFLRGEQFHQAETPEDHSYLIGGKCRGCGEVFFPNRSVCPLCIKNGTMEEVQLSTRGKIYSYSVLGTSLPGFKAPYMIGRTELPEGPRVVSPISGCEPVEGVISIGDEVELDIGKISEDEQGNDVIGFSFRPVKPGERG